VNVDDNMTLMI